MLWRLTSRWARISPDWKRWRRYARENLAHAGHGQSASIGPQVVPCRGVAQREAALRRQGAAVAGEPGRHHAIEHVDAEADRRQQLGVRPEPHEVPGPVVRNLGDARSGHRQHGLDRLPDRQPADGDPVEVEPGDEARRLPARRCVEAPLRDAEEQAALARMDGAAALGPAMGPRGRLLRLPDGGAVGDRVVEAHEHVGAEPGLVPHRILGGDPQPGTVIRRDEGRRIVVDRRDLDKAHQLVSAAVGEDRVLPAHEGVEPARPLDQLDARPQRQVVRVAEQDVDARGAHLVGVQRLDGRVRSHRHERRRAHDSMGRGERTGARGTIDRVNGERGAHDRRQQSMQSPSDRNR